jgi:uncharacterized protein (TIGR02145 family)
MKKRILTLGASVLLCSSLNAFEYNILKGTQILGAVENMGDLTIFKDKCVDYIYYKEYQKEGEPWAYYSANTEFPHEGTQINYIEKGQGFLLQASENCKIDTNVDDSETLIFKDLVYKTIIAPNGDIWLDRNLGATKACYKPRGDFPDDQAYIESQQECFGDLYQWGRAADGHEKRNSKYYNASATHYLQQPPFFFKGRYNGDWITQEKYVEERAAYYGYTEGGICPEGFHVPSLADAKAATKDMAIEEILSTFKLGFQGTRTDNNNLWWMGQKGGFWTTTAGAAGIPHTVKSFEYEGTHVSYLNGYRAYGRAIRCMKTPQP